MKSQTTTRAVVRSTDTVAAVTSKLDTLYITQKGCIKFSYFSGEAADRLPQNHGCVKGTSAPLRFRTHVGSGSRRS